MASILVVDDEAGKEAVLASLAGALEKASRRKPAN
jgi:hypothetical protein